MKTLIAINLAYMLESMNYAFIVPSLPFIFVQLHATTMEEGYTFSLYAVTQMISILHKII